MRTSRYQIIAAVVVATTVGVAGCGDDQPTEKSGGQTASVVALRLGTVELSSAPYAKEVEHFADAVESLSDGSIDVEVVWAAAGDDYTAETEQQVATMVKDGELDAAIVPTRVWDKLDVTSMQALQAPFLIDSLDLVQGIATSDLAGQMMAGLDPIGIKGLALWPESLRHPIGVAQPLLTPADFAGARLRVPISDISYRLAEAIGVEPVDPQDWSAAIAAGELDGFESAFVWSNDLPSYGTFTGNITFYPKLNNVVMNAGVFGKLNEAQKAVVQRAATETIAFIEGAHETERQLADDYCTGGGSVAIASDGDVAALVSKAAPVLAELEQNAATQAFIDDIRTMKDRTTVDPSSIPHACQSHATDESTVPSATAEPLEFPEGTYRAELPDGGVVTMTFVDGVWEAFTATNELDCAGIYTVESGRIFMSNSTDVALACGNPPGLQFLDAAWTLDGDQLRFVDINSDPNAVRDFGVAWTKIG